MLGSCGVAQEQMEVLDWSVSTAPSASTALPSRPPGSPGCGWGRAEEWPRPRPVLPPERLRLGVGHGAGAASITADSPTRKGHPARRPAAGRRAGPTKGGWVGLEKRRARLGASAELLPLLSLLCDFLLPLQFSRVAVRLPARSLYSVASVGRPYSG